MYQVCLPSAQGFKLDFECWRSWRRISFHFEFFNLVMESIIFINFLNDLNQRCWTTKTQSSLSCKIIVWTFHLTLCFFWLDQRSPRFWRTPASCRCCSLRRRTWASWKQQNQLILHPALICWDSRNRIVLRLDWTCWNQSNDETINFRLLDV